MDLHLAGRDMAELDALRRDLMLRGEVAVSIHDFDVLRDDSGFSLLEELPRLPDVAVCMVGLLLPQSEEADAGASERVLRTNFVAPMLLMSELAARFRRRGSGVLVGVSSVAGDRGRASNYVYGSAKAGFTAFLSGLRADLASSGVHVLTVKPGFVKTRMTEGMDLPAPLTAEASEAADAILVGNPSAQEHGLCATSLAPDHASDSEHSRGRVQAATALVRTRGTSTKGRLAPSSGGPPRRGWRTRCRNASGCGG